MNNHIPKPIEFLVIEEENEIHREVPELYLPCSSGIRGCFSSDSGSRQFIGHGRSL